MTIQNLENKPLIKKALSRIYSILYPHKRQGFFPEDGVIESNGIKYRLASFNKRLLSSGFDMIVASFITLPIGSAIANLTTGDKLNKFKMNPELMINDIDIGTMLHLAWDSGVLINMILVQLFTLFLIGCYTVLCWVKTGSTLGKMIFKCKVVDAKTLKKLSVQQAIIRFIVMPFSVLPLLIGIFMIDWNKKKQALHDKIANTVVVYKDTKLT